MAVQCHNLFQLSYFLLFFYKIFHRPLATTVLVKPCYYFFLRWSIQKIKVLLLKGTLKNLTLNHSKMGVGVPCIGQVNFTVWPTSTFSVRALTEALGGPGKEIQKSWETWRIIVNDNIWAWAFFLHLLSSSIINSPAKI